MRRIGFLLSLAALTGCSDPAAEVPPPVDVTRTHAVVSVDQQLTSLTESQAALEVMVSVLRVPASINSDRLLRLIGMGNSVPPHGSCEVVSDDQLERPALAQYERVELLDVGDITLSTTHSSRKLSRQAFPSITDFISGVLYTTRELASDLTIDRTLSLRARGNSSVQAFGVKVGAVAPPQQVLVDGQALGEVSRMSLGSPNELRWTKGRDGDTVWVELGTFGGKKSLSCAFNDSAGTGVIPQLLLSEVGDGQLTFHRVSSQPLTVAGVDKAEARFDIHLSVPVRLY